jgi:hypothetical protein
MEDYEKFLTALAKVDYNFYRHKIESSNWSTDILSFNSTDEKFDEDKHTVVFAGPPEIVCSLYASFPKELYPRILEMMETYLFRCCQQERFGT